MKKELSAPLNNFMVFRKGTDLGNRENLIFPRAILIGLNVIYFSLTFRVAIILGCFIFLHLSLEPCTSD